MVIDIFLVNFGAYMNILYGKVKIRVDIEWSYSAPPPTHTHIQTNIRLLSFKTWPLVFNKQTLYSLWPRLGDQTFILLLCGSLRDLDNCLTYNRELKLIDTSRLGLKVKCLSLLLVCTPPGTHTIIKFNHKTIDSIDLSVEWNWNFTSQNDKLWRVANTWKWTGPLRWEHCRFLTQNICDQSLGMY